MTDPATRAPGTRGFSLGDPVGAGVIGLAALLLAILARLPLGYAVALAAVAVAAPILLGAPRWGLGPALPVVPSMAAVGLLATRVPASPLAEAAGAVAGVALLVAVGRAAQPPDRRARATGGALLPGLCAALAVATASLFPASDRLEGVAAAILLGVVVALAALVAEPSRAGGAGTAPS